MNILKTCFFLFTMTIMGYCMTAEDKYANGIILRCENPENDNYNYYLNSKFIGANEVGMNLFLSEISKLPDYSIVIVNNLNKSDRDGKTFFKDKKFVGMLNEIKKEKHLFIVFFEKGQFDYSISDIEFVYIQYIVSKRFGERIFYLNSKKMGTDDSGYSQLVAELNTSKKKFIFVTFKQQGFNTTSIPSEFINGSDELEKYLDDSKRNYFMNDIGSGSVPIFHDYQVELLKSQLKAEEAKVEAEVDSLLPGIFREITMKGRFKTLSSVVSQINSSLNPHIAYTVSLSCPDMKLVFDCENADITTVIKFLCTSYKLKVTLEGNKIILGKRDVGNQG